MPIVERSGSIFTSDAQVLVNTVNCVGVMGAGIALEMRYRHPDMFRRYEAKCASGEIRIGALDLDTATTPWILNFPTKKHWRHPSRPEYLRAGLKNFCDRWEDWGITSVAFPMLGASHGGIKPDESRAIMIDFLADLPIDIEIWTYSPRGTDDLVPRLRQQFSQLPDGTLARESALSVKAIGAIRAELDRIEQLGQLAAIPGFGERTLGLTYSYAQSIDPRSPVATQAQLQLDD